MTNEDKNLLLKDLCARLPYNLYIRVEELNVPKNEAITEGFIGNYLKDNRCNDYDAEGILNELADGCIDVKPYLRPMSSMTKEELKELKQEHLKDSKLFAECLTKAANGDTSMIGKVVPHFAADWCNKNHFDYRGLIPMGLALEAPEEMYKNE